MPLTNPSRPRVFVDADVLFCRRCRARRTGASLVILCLAEITLIEVMTSQQVLVEAERNLGEKLPETLATFRLIVSRCLRQVKIFPPAALDAHDNFFSRRRPSSDESPDRLYVGVCAPGTRLKTVLIRGSTWLTWLPRNPCTTNTGQPPIPG